MIGKRPFKAIFILVFTAFIATCTSDCQHAFKTGKTEAYDYINREVLKDDGRLITYPDAKLPIHEELGIWPNDVLAESMGLALLYFVETDKQEKFDKTWWFIENRMMSEYGLIAWKFDATAWAPLTSSATIDDFRIVKALMLAYKKWGNGRYLAEGLKLGNAIKKHEVVDGFPTEFFAWGGSTSVSNIVDLSYLDLYAMRLLASYDPEWQDILHRSGKLLLDSLTQHGLFYDKYSLESKRFYNKDNNLINKLICAIHLAEVNVYKAKVVNFIEKEVFRTGILKGRYDPHSGKATVNYDSAAVYALALRFSVIYQQEALTDKLLEKLLAYQQSGPPNKLRGCFGYKNCHSFDTLQAMLTLNSIDDNLIASKRKSKK